MKNTILEQSTHSHVLHHNEEIEVLELDRLSGKIIKTQKTDRVKVIHGEHNMLGFEQTNIIKVNQQEFNPITQQIQDAAD